MLEDYGHLDGWERGRFRFIPRGQVRLDPDVQLHFETSEEVNEALRSLIAEGRVPSVPRK
ncbi:MAG TPA: hypothetical protein VEZ11_18165 [Thermoanaerobaculia bacterium]|nr:hypothetical protein [Thermoanaerobaculia bacterium]